MHTPDIDSNRCDDHETAIDDGEGIKRCSSGMPDMLFVYLADYKTVSASAAQMPGTQHVYKARIPGNMTHTLARHMHSMQAMPSTPQSALSTCLFLYRDQGDQTIAEVAQHAYCLHATCDARYTCIHGIKTGYITVN